MGDEFDGSEGIGLGDLGIGGGEIEATPEGGLGSPPSGAPAGEAQLTPTTSPEGVAPAAPAAPAAWTAAPKSWRQEMHQHYGTLPPDVQRYIHEREQQALEGLMRYKQEAEQFTSIFQPYQQVMQQAGIQPHNLVANLARNHHVLATGTPEQRYAVARQLLREYNLDPRELIFGGRGAAPADDGQAPAQPQLPPEIAQLPQTVQSLQGWVATQQRVAIQKQIDEFASKNEFFSDVEADIAQLISSGAAENLEQAYELAVFRNPEVRQRYLAAQASKQAAQAQQAAAGKRAASSVNIQPSGGQPAQQVGGSLDATLDAIASKHYG